MVEPGGSMPGVEGSIPSAPSTIWMRCKVYHRYTKYVMWYPVKNPRPGDVQYMRIAEMT